MHAFALTVMTVLAEDPKPDDNDVVAGPVGAIVIGALVLAVVLIAFAFTRSLRSVQRAKEAGVYGDQPPASADPDQSDRPGDGD